VLDAGTKNRRKIEYRYPGKLAVYGIWKGVRADRCGYFTATLTQRKEILGKISLGCEEKWGLNKKGIIKDS
jgi:hypothetical protein